MDQSGPHLWVISLRISLTALYQYGDFITLSQAGYGLQDTLSEGSGGVLNAGSQAQCILEVRFLYQQLPVWSKLWRPGQQGGDTVHKLRNQASVGVVSLTEMVGYHLKR